MIAIPLRDLRNNFSKLEAWLEEGESIQIKKRGKPIALLTSFKHVSTSQKLGKKMPDFAARRKAIWKKRVFTAREVAALRLDELGEED